jgi:PAS domain S-box-containing protein
MSETSLILLIGTAAQRVETLPPDVHRLQVFARAAADEQLASGGCSLVLSTLDEPLYPWRELLESASACDPPPTVVLLSRPDDAAGAVEAMRRGAEVVVMTHDALQTLTRQLGAVLARPHVHRTQSAHHATLAEPALQVNQARLQFLLAHTPAVIFTVRVDGVSTPTFISESVREMLGYEAAEFLGQPDFWFRHLHPDDAARLHNSRSPLFTHGTSTLEYRFLHADGSYRWLQSGSLLVRDERGAPFEIIGYMIDVNARHEAEAALRQANAELSQANQELARAAHLKDDFLASMSHELRTPLHAVLGRAETLLEQIHGPLTERQMRAVKSIEESGRNLLELINDVLDLSRIEAGRMELNLAPMAIEPACHSCIAAIAAAARQKQLTVSLQLEPGLTSVVADERRIKQVLLNLLTNAVKFTSEGGTIGLDVSSDETSGELRLLVWDTGIGIAAGEISRLFKPFVQLDSRLAREYNGTGLGLVLVERIMALHGGRVWVESELGQGSRFGVTLPIERKVATSHGATPSFEARALPGTQPIPSDPLVLAPLVLLVDDSADNLLVTRTYLARHGYDVATAANGYDAVARTVELQPALVLMDVCMPGLDGAAAIARIRANQATAGVPIIALSGLTSQKERQRCLDAGANEYLTKPVGLRELMQKIAAYLNAGRENTFR